VPPFLYRCPITGEKVQARASDDPEEGSYVQVMCLACAQAYLVNPKSGKVLGADDE
jgi:RNase P subunit RPR2